MNTKRAKDATGVAVDPIARPGFDLRTQPWLPMITLDGRTERVGLDAALRHAHRFHRLVGETPTMTAALYRLLLALLHRIYGPATETSWAQLWSSPTLPPDPLTNYLTEKFPSRFDLLDPVRPFLQCRALATVPMSTPAKLVPYLSVGNNVTLFDHTTAADETSLDADAAARWLVTLQAFDPGGMKTPYVREKSSKQAPCSVFGVVLVEGSTLKETLLLNALPYDPQWELPDATTRPDDRPAWESPEDPDPHPRPAVPSGWTDLLTWPSRRVLLSGTADGIVGVVITPGTRLDSELCNVEMMAAFRKPTGPRGMPKSDAPLVPVRLHPLRGVWRHSTELLITDLRAEGRTRQRPRTLARLAERSLAGHIPADAVYTLRVFGQQLDSKGSVVEAWLEESVAAPVALLRSQDDTTGALIGWAVTLADQAGSALRRLENQYRAEMRADPGAGMDLAYWPRLTIPFNKFLRGLGDALTDNTSQTPVIEEWIRQVRRHAQQAARRWIRDTGPDTRLLFAAGQHHEEFQRQLNTAVNEFRDRGARHTTTREPA